MITFTVKPTSSHPPPCLMLMLAHSSNKLIISANLPQQDRAKSINYTIFVQNTPVKQTAGQCFDDSDQDVWARLHDFELLLIDLEGSWLARAQYFKGSCHSLCFFFLLSPSTRSVVAGCLKSRELFSTPSRGWIGSGSGQAVLDVPEHYRYGVEPVGLLD